MSCFRRKRRPGFGSDAGRDPKTRDEYGRTEFGQSCLMARRLVENGVRFVTVNYGVAGIITKIFAENLDKKLPEQDRGFSALIRDLHQRGLLAETIVLAMGEFGRTPKLSKDAGRDHWGRAGSIIFAGAGVRGGQVIGATDQNGALRDGATGAAGGCVLDGVRGHSRDRSDGGIAHTGRATSFDPGRGWLDPGVVYVRMALRPFGADCATVGPLARGSRLFRAMGGGL